MTAKAWNRKNLLDNETSRNNPRSSGPKYVITGNNAFRNECLKTIVHLPIPFARANFTYSLLFCSSILERVNFAIMPVCVKAIASDGNIV